MASVETMEDRYSKELKNVLTRGRHSASRRRPRGSSAILIPVLIRDGEYSLLFEVRASDLKTQPGEVCFPGGGMEKDESPRQTAIRETMEELLVREDQIEIIGKLDPTATPSNAPLWSYIAVLHDYQGTWSADEVDHVFEVPLKFFMETEPRHELVDLRQVPGEDFPYELIPGGRSYGWRMKKHEILFYPTEPVIWGMTARVVYHLTWMIRAGEEKEKTILLCSDIHGKKDRFERIFRKEREGSGISAVMIAGDLEIPKKEIQAITGEVPVYAVKGNCDRGREWPEISVFNLYGHRFMLTHGHRFGGANVTALQREAVKNRADIVVFGHIHRQVEIYRGKILLVNPGAIVGCRDTGKPGYMIMKIMKDRTIRITKKEAEW